MKNSGNTITSGESERQPVSSSAKPSRLPKPPSVWGAQAQLAVMATSCAYFLPLFDDDSVVIAFALVTALFVVAIVGLQIRRPWARWLAIVLLAMLAVGVLSSALKSTPYSLRFLALVLVTMVVGATVLLLAKQPTTVAFFKRD